MSLEPAQQRSSIITPASAVPPVTGVVRPLPSHLVPVAGVVRPQHPLSKLAVLLARARVQRRRSPARRYDSPHRNHTCGLAYRGPRRRAVPLSGLSRLRIDGRALRAMCAARGRAGRAAASHGRGRHAGAAPAAARGGGAGQTCGNRDCRT